MPNRLRWRVYADTNALYPIGIADLLLRLADDKVIELLWTDYLLDEVERVLVDKKGLPRTAAQYFCQCIRDTFPQGHIPEADYRDLIDSRTGPDADDHPHSAAAISGRADVLLSADSKGFPPNDVHPAIRMSPDEFFTILMDVNGHPKVKDTIIGNLEQMATHRRVPIQVEEVIANLRRSGLTRFAERVLRDR